MTGMLAGFALGVAGSVHCAAMCGPLVLAVRPVRTPGRVMLYHTARVSMYAVAGLIAGAIGQTSQMVGLGRIVSIAAGLALLVFAARRAGLTVGPSNGNRVSGQLAKLMIAVRRGTAGRPLIGVVAAGAMNALLPCGLVYAAIAAATALGTTTNAVSFMVSFGLGTVPMLAVTSALVRSMPLAARTRLRFAAPLALAMVGVLLIARGLIAPHGHAIPLDQAQVATHLHAH
jgi:sulfite exporter TauE/SafE